MGGLGEAPGGDFFQTGSPDLSWDIFLGSLVAPDKQGPADI